MATLFSEGALKPLRRDDDQGVVTRLGNTSLKVYRIALDASGNFVSATLETTVTTDAQGVIPDITVTGAVGTIYRIRCEDDGQKRCGFWDQLAS
jgi:hypothetical protein